VTISGGSGGGGTGDFQWQDPPTRSTTESVNDDYGNDLQSAVDNASSDTELVLDNGPYEGQIIIDATELTLTGGDTKTTVELTSAGSPMFDEANLSNTTIDISGSISTGDTTISVSNASAVSAGDTVRIRDDNRTYRGLEDLNTGGGIGTGEFHEVESVDTGSDTITLSNGADRDYASSTSLDCDIMDWTVDNVHFDNLTLNGYSTSDSGSYRAASLTGRDMWFTDLDGSTWGQEFIALRQSFRCYLDNCSCSDLGDTGFTATDGTKNVIGRSLTVDSPGHYGIASTWNSVYNPAYNHHWLDCNVTGSADAAYDQHHGSEAITFENCEYTGPAGDAYSKARGLNTTWTGGVIDTEDDYGFQMTQKPDDVTISGLEMVDCYRAFLFWAKEGYDCENWTVEDCQFTTSTGEIMRLRDPDDGSHSSSYTIYIDFINCAMNGNWVDDATVENSNNFGSSSVTVEYTTVYPSDQTPSEYFG
jgi:hypothetical protein